MFLFAFLTDLFSAVIYKLEEIVYKCNIYSIYEFALNSTDRIYSDYQEFEFSDQQITLLTVGFCTLFGNLFLINSSWRKSNQKIIKKFKKRAKRKAIADLKRSVDQLKLPKTHSPRI